MYNDSIDLYLEINMIDARALHLELGVKRCFTTWIKGRIKSLCLSHERDYFTFDSMSEKGTHPKARSQKIKIYRLTQIAAQKIRDIETRKVSCGVFESIALSTIEQVMGVKLERQYRVGKYKIDGYHKNSNTAYEIDEEQHYINGKLKQDCADRQRYIEGEIGCKFIRVKV